MRSVSGPLRLEALDAAVMNDKGELTLPANIPGAWIVADQTITPSGRVFVLPVVMQCQNGTHEECWNWLARQHLRQEVTYQPAGRYWDMQAHECAIYLALALDLSGVCVWRVRGGLLH
ncbi:hypothetical protein KGA66_19120 [Actinocrinis puniceicyclus]|uniref:Uncharacterized protein n=1 Tax=Actinocrinis puniceicyclus TaxID=977794 RepID=A0A8J8BE52_9ACTN|nr:hypothetical protein [Actinocrinis puniceicyclus]MBS2965170.1 hypothetical protein [Actinocrinis puniceicyclus]